MEPTAPEIDDPLHWAAQKGDLEAVHRLIEEGVPVNAFDELARTALHYAAMKGHFEVVAYLLDHGADVNARDEARIGDTPLGEIAGNCSFRMAKMLIDAGADPTIRGWMQLNAIDRARNRKRGDGPAVIKLLASSARPAVIKLLASPAKRKKPKRER